MEAIKLKPYVMKKNLFISIDNYTILKKILDNKLSDYLPNFLSNPFNCSRKYENTFLY